MFVFVIAYCPYNSIVGIVLAFLLDGSEGYPCIPASVQISHGFKTSIRYSKFKCSRCFALLRTIPPTTQEIGKCGVGALKMSPSHCRVAVWLCGDEPRERRELRRGHRRATTGSKKDRNSEWFILPPGVTSSTRSTSTVAFSSRILWWTPLDSSKALWLTLL